MKKRSGIIETQSTGHFKGVFTSPCDAAQRTREKEVDNRLPLAYNPHLNRKVKAEVGGKKKEFIKVRESS